MDIANKRAEKIIAKLSDLISQTEELKIERGVTSRSVRLWKKDTKSKYAAFVIDKERLGKYLSEKEEEIERRKEDSKREQQMEDERRLCELCERQQNHERTADDWVRFENMFLTQVDAKSISDEEKFGYLIESVGPKVRDRIANLKPGSMGYRTAWERLKKEFGQTKVVINTHIDEIINLPLVKGTNYFKIQEFYERLSNNYDALQHLKELRNYKGL
ncbi:hypothetical protein ACROYT_G013946 [Oculina patagonica]